MGWGRRHALDYGTRGVGHASNHAAEFGERGVGHHCIEGLGWHSERHSFRCTNAVGREWKPHYFSGNFKLSKQISAIFKWQSLDQLRLRI